MVKQDFSLNSSKSKQLLNYAFKNKVLLLLLYGCPSLREPALYCKLISQREKFLSGAADVSSALNNANVDFVVFKTLRPVPDAPIDIDMLVPNRQSVTDSINALRKRFTVEVWGEDAYSIGLRLAETGEFVDIYLKPHVANFVYLGHNLFFEKRRYLGLDSVKVPLPSFEAEALAIVAHAIIKEQLVTLNDVISVTILLQSGDFEVFLELARKERLLPTVKMFFESLASLHFPHPVGYKYLFKAMLTRASRLETVESVPSFLEVLPHRAALILEHSKRKTYLRGLNR